MRPLAFLTLLVGLVAGITASTHAGERYVSVGGHVGVQTQHGYDRTLGHGHARPAYRSAHRTRSIGVGVGVGVQFGSRHHRAAPRVHAPRVKHHRRVIQTHGYANRTKFCRMERAIDARTHRKVRVKRCIYVRNDLLGNYAGGGWAQY